MTLSAAEKQRRLRRKRLLAGLCMACGKRPPELGKSRCTECKLKHNYNSAIRNAERRSLGLCYCGSLAKDGFTTCDRHLIIANNRQDIKNVVAIITNSCIRCGKPATKRCCPECATIFSECKKRHRRKLQKIVFDHYGGCYCNCCGEAELLFLTLDHINNDGAAHRRSLRNGRQTTSERLYRWLRDNNYPNGFQVLCINCNLGKYRNNGICPHKLIAKEQSST